MIPESGWAGLLPEMAAALVFGYLVGSIPFGVVCARIGGLGDLRKVGSGNIGATNMLRTGRKDLAAITLVGDTFKGTIAVLIAASLPIAGPIAGMIAGLIAGFGAFLGHLYPVWLRFHGGKGVATYIGILLAVAWPVALVFVALWLLTAWLLRFSSLAALVATTATPLVFALMDRPAAALLFAAMTALVYITHRTNIVRLARGEEGRISLGSKGK